MDHWHTQCVKGGNGVLDIVHPDVTALRGHNYKGLSGPRFWADF